MGSEREFEQLLASAWSRVVDARALLAQPRACHPDACMALFGEAQASLERLRDTLPARGPAFPNVRRQALALAGQLGQTSVLVERAAQLGRRWLASLQSAAPEYTAAGGPAPPANRRCISLLG